ncbi:hypothetical protein LZ554_005066 [Drepanopeziza brunnea f. sp. 'monogermtubi']|nr:hypothetical protein LZ554_005066 [Drepanopeziza brunnea f. sp. 'monogermtubi']
MRSSLLSAATALAGSTLVYGQTFSDCNPVKGEKCPPKAGLGTTLVTDHTKPSTDWTKAVATNLKYGPDGAEFTIAGRADAPTIGTDKYIFFGKVSVTLKASPGAGTVSSFILESDTLDEIDWEWLGSDDSNVQSNFFGKGNTTTYDRAQYHPVAAPIENYMTYTIDWTKDSIKWYIGDDMVRELKNDDPKTLGGKNYPQTPMRVKMGSWIGCLDAAAAANPSSQGTCQWAGGPIDLTQGPFTMYVKSSTIQDYGCGGEYSYTDSSGSWESIESTGKCDGKGTPDIHSTSVAASPTKSSATSKSGGVMVETAASMSSKASSSGSSTVASSTGAPSPVASGTSGTSGTAESAANSSDPSVVNTNAGTVLKPKHQYGALDLGVMALGLGLGYLFM